MNENVLLHLFLLFNSSKLSLPNWIDQLQSDGLPPHAISFLKKLDAHYPNIVRDMKINGSSFPHSARKFIH
jgi:hypothetical protein